jgi:YbbR domain-containing protein
MKRIVILSCFLLAAMAFVSCTNDEIEPNKPSATTSILADDGLGGNSTGQTPTTPPKK